MIFCGGVAVEVIQSKCIIAWRCRNLPLLVLYSYTQPYAFHNSRVCNPSSTSQNPREAAMCSSCSMCFVLVKSKSSPVFSFLIGTLGIRTKNIRAGSLDTFFQAYPHECFSDICLVLDSTVRSFALHFLCRRRFGVRLGGVKMEDVRDSSLSEHKPPLAS
jgi:hypothetical protein